MRRNGPFGTWKLVLLAGFAGGFAEILWVMLYSSATGASSAAIAREVAASIWPALATGTLAPALGIVIHMALAIALAALIVPPLVRLAERRREPSMMMVAAMTALALVWAINFLLVLPILNPGFVAMMPYGATLVSKLLFGIAMAGVLQGNAVRILTRK
jgi:hypothetical protein